MSDEQEKTLGERVEEAVEDVKEAAAKGLEAVRKVDEIMEVIEPHLDKAMPVVAVAVGTAVPGAGLAFEVAKVAKDVAKPMVKEALGIADELEGQDADAAEQTLYERLQASPTIYMTKREIPSVGTPVEEIRILTRPVLALARVKHEGLSPEHRGQIGVIIRDALKSAFPGTEVMAVDEAIEIELYMQPIFVYAEPRDEVEKPGVKPLMEGV